MNQIDYLNVNINQLIELIRKDTNNYRNLKTSLCGRAFELENEILEKDKLEIEELTNAIDNENVLYEAKLKELENETKGFSIFSKKLKKSKLEKSITKEHENQLMIFNSRLNRKKQQYEENRILLQEIIDKLASRGIIWHHARKIIAKHMKESSNKIERPNLDKKEMKQKLKPKLKPVKFDENIEDKKDIKTTIDGSDDENRRTFKEKNFMGLEEIYKILGLTPEEFREYQIILQYIYSNRERIKDVEISIRLRLALAMDGHLGQFKNLAVYASDFALYNDIFKYLSMNDGDYYENKFKRYITAKVNNDRFELSKMDRFYRIEAMNLMQNSGFESEFIQRNYGAFEKEIKALYTSPGEMRRIIDRINYPAQSYEQMYHAFQDLIKQEIYFRLRNMDMNQNVTLQTNAKPDDSLEHVSHHGILNTLLGEGDKHCKHHEENDMLHDYDDHHHDEYHGNQQHRRHRREFFDERQSLFETFEDSLNDYDDPIYTHNYSSDYIDTDDDIGDTDVDDTDNSELEEEQQYYND